MGIRSIALAASTGVWLFSVGIAPAYAATTVYSYEGNTFNSFSGGGPWDATDKITASLTMSSALGANLVNEYVIPVSWSVSDGVQTITEATGNANQRRPLNGCRGIVILVTSLYNRLITLTYYLNIVG